MFEVGEFGTDLNFNFSFKDGDLNLVSDKENLTQSLQNRLNAVAGSYDLFYSDYGGFISSFLGWKADNTTLQFLEKEINVILSQEPRLGDYTVKLEYEQGNVKIYLTLQYDDDSDLSMSFTIDNQTGEVVADEDNSEE